jgi:hypothetical protein
MKKTKGEKRPARNATREDNILKEPNIDADFLSQYEEDWHSVAGGGKKKKPKMPISGKSVFKIKNIIHKKTLPGHKQ